jgi:hypothetical protein
LTHLHTGVSNPARKTIIRTALRGWDRIARRGKNTLTSASSTPTARFDWFTIALSAAGHELSAQPETPSPPEHTLHLGIIQHPDAPMLGPLA